MAQQLFRIVLVLALCVSALSCGCGSNSKVTKANADRITEGMSQEEVLAILGPPTESTSGVRDERGAITHQMLQWNNRDKVIMIGFMNGKVATIATMGF